MKGRDLRETLIGGATLVALAMLLAVSYWSQPLEASASFGGYRLNAVFNRIDGLSVGDPVYLAGIEVGSVETMRLDRHYRALVALRIRSDVAVPADTAAAIHTDGLFGPKYISLDPGGDEKMLSDGGRIEFTQDALIVSDLLNLVIERGKAARKQASKGQ